jgi:hypothetical protein
MSGKLMTWEAAVQYLKSQLAQQEIIRHCYSDDPLVGSRSNVSKLKQYIDFS